MFGQVQEDLIFLVRDKSESAVGRSSRIQAAVELAKLPCHCRAGLFKLMI